jgi:hypothetical protein
MQAVSYADGDGAGVAAGADFGVQGGGVAGALVPGPGQVRFEGVEGGFGDGGVQIADGGGGRRHTRSPPRTHADAPRSPRSAPQISLSAPPARKTPAP